MNVLRTLRLGALVGVVMAAVGAAEWLGPAAHAQVGKSVTIVDANLISEADLAALPGMNPTRAKAVIAKRPFTSITPFDQALTASGLTREQINTLYARAFVPVNLNTVTREEVLLIPGAGNRMAREFLEYKPYRGLAQFHREIGKYVDAQELARLAQYVFVPVDLNTATDADILSIPGAGNRMVREFKEYRPWRTMEQFRREIGKYVSKEEVARLERYVMIAGGNQTAR